MKTPAPCCATPSRAGTIRSLDDFDRPLNERGLEGGAARSARELQRARSSRSTCVLASPAARVRETLDGVAEGYGAPLDVRFERAHLSGAERTT